MTAMLGSPYLSPILLLLGSNVFMTMAWYGHLKFKQTPRECPESEVRLSFQHPR